MKSVDSGSDPVNPTPENACEWVEHKMKSHELNSNTGRLYTTATRALAGMLRDDEPRTLEYFLENLAELVRRWCIANAEAEGSTGQTYASRARSAVGAYLRWRENPSGFRFESRQPGLPRKKKESDTTVPSTGAAPPPMESRAEMASIPLPGKKPFRFELHDGLTRNDVMRIMWGLFVHCEDFDPTVHTPAPPATGIVPHESPVS